MIFVSAVLFRQNRSKQDAHLSGHHLSISTRDLHAGIQTCAIVRFHYGTPHRAVRSNAAVVRTWGGGQESRFLAILHNNQINLMVEVIVILKLQSGISAL